VQNFGYRDRAIPENPFKTMNRTTLFLLTAAVAVGVGIAASHAMVRFRSTGSALALNPVGSAQPLPPRTPRPEPSSLRSPTPPIDPAFARSTPQSPTRPTIQRPSMAPSSVKPLQITTCYGKIRSANFRQSPTLQPSAILGVVAHRDSVTLTGRTTYGEGLLWYEATAARLIRSIEPGAQNQLNATTGWISSCFVHNSIR
jgi:hypothetical protein